MRAYFLLASSMLLTKKTRPVEPKKSYRRGYILNNACKHFLLLGRRKAYRICCSQKGGREEAGKS